MFYELNDDVLIVPDVHGRTFWKDAESFGGTIVFLGDYLDPYPQEGITNDDAWINFMAIIDFKKRNPNRVHLLLGNHEVGYFDKIFRNNRTDLGNYERNHKFLIENKELFDVTFTLKSKSVDGIDTVLLSHAGIIPDWLDFVQSISCFSFPETEDVASKAEYLNQLFHSDSGTQLLQRLNMVSYFRFGDYPFGGPLWADINEFIESEKPAFKNVLQIVGHTQQFPNGQFERRNLNYICVDCRKLFLLDKDLNVKTL